MGGVDVSKSSGQQWSTESALARTQNEILKDREQLFKNWYLPEFKSTMNEFSPNSVQGNAAMNLTAKGINASFDTAQKQTMQSLSQRNMLDSGAGIALSAANNRARASALADAYANQMANSTTNKAQMLNSMSTLMPSTSTAAPTLSFGKQSSTSVGVRA